LLARPSRPAQIGIVAAVLAGLMTLTWLQVRHWRDSVTLWRHAIAVDPANARAHSNLGNVLMQQDRPQEAIEHLRKSVRLDPQMTLPEFLLAELLLRQGELDEAADHFRKAARANPNMAPAHFQLGRIALRRQRWKEAIGHFQDAARIDAAGAAREVHAEGQELARQGEWQGAQRCFKLAAELQGRQAEQPFREGP
jgi:tetratricopeptide (TPR) repeat protein